MKSNSTWGDNINQVKEEDGVVALGKGQTRIYMGDGHGVSQVNKEGKGKSLAEVEHMLKNHGVMLGEVCMRVC
jgi:hypothetical protein